MKKLILILALLTTVAILSCEKEHCWACTQTTIYEIPGYLPDTAIVKSGPLRPHKRDSKRHGGLADLPGRGVPWRNACHDPQLLSLYGGNLVGM